MTFTEAAIEILRRAGNPLSVKQITEQAIAAGLLSHVGQTPEATMGARLLAMAKREHDRTVAAVDTGTFALVQWGLAATAPAVEVEAQHADERPYRSRERHPPLQEEYVPGGRRDHDRRRARDDDEGRRKRYPPPSEVAFALLTERGEPMALEALAKALREKDRIAEALERDLQSFERALKEENRRRQDGGRSPLFDIADGKVTALEQPKEREQRRPERAPDQRRERREEVRPVGAADEQRRHVLRTVRRRLAGLDMGALERVAVALLESQGYRELNMARRSAKDGPLYLCRRKWGSGELRYAIRVLRPGRELGRTEVQEVRRDLAHYSAQLGVVFALSDCTREAKGEANAPGGTPVMLYGGDAFAEALVEAGLGVSRRVIEWLEFDDAFFQSMGAGADLPEVAETLPADAAPAAPPAAPADQPREERGRRGRDRDRRREREARAEPSVEAAAGTPSEPSSDAVAGGPNVVAAPEFVPSSSSADAAEPPVAAATEPPLTESESSSGTGPVAEASEPAAADAASAVSSDLQ